MNILEIHQKAYEIGKPLISDSEYDKLCTIFQENTLGFSISEKKNKHRFQLYSLQKVFDNEVHNLDGRILVESVKLDGCAASIEYINGIFIKATTRGNGIIGDDCTRHFIEAKLVPLNISAEIDIQISGEVVLPKDVPNARNIAAGSLGLKDLSKLKDRELSFIAYSLKPYYSNFDSNFANTYTADITMLSTWGFKTILSKHLEKKYKTDGKVYRLDSNKEYDEMGRTSIFPKGAYARKQTSDIEIKETFLNDVKWQVGKGGKITPVAIFDEIIIDDAKISRATLHNAEFVENLDLSIGDILLITRSGGIIPKVLGKVHNE